MEIKIMIVQMFPCKKNTSFSTTRHLYEFGKKSFTALSHAVRVLEIHKFDFPIAVHHNDFHWFEYRTTNYRTVHSYHIKRFSDLSLTVQFLQN